MQETTRQAFAHGLQPLVQLIRLVFDSLLRHLDDRPLPAWSAMFVGMKPRAAENWRPSVNQGSIGPKRKLIELRWAKCLRPSPGTTYTDARDLLYSDFYTLPLELASGRPRVCGGMH
jgi:hypothetical protein